MEKNIPLLVFDTLFLPITLMRAIIIYFMGSKYNIIGFKFLDVLMHADNPFFNQESEITIDTIDKDLRLIIRDDSRIYPKDISMYLDRSGKLDEINKKLEKEDNEDDEILSIERKLDEDSDNSKNDIDFGNDEISNESSIEDSIDNDDINKKNSSLNTLTATENTHQKIDEAINQFMDEI